MREFLLAIIDVTRLLLTILAGGMWLGNTVEEFAKKHYYRFGWSALLALWCMVSIIKITLGGLT